MYPLLLQTRVCGSEDHHHRSLLHRIREAYFFLRNEEIAPSRAGLDAANMLANPLSGYLLWNVEPGADSLHDKAVETLRAASFVVAVTPFPGWKVLRVLGNLLNLAGFEQNSSEEVRDALRQQIEKTAAPLAAAGTMPAIASGSGARVEGVQVYQADAIVRRAVSLQKTREARAPHVVYGAPA